MHKERLGRLRAAKAARERLGREAQQQGPRRRRQWRQRLRTVFKKIGSAPLADPRGKY